MQAQVDTQYAESDGLSIAYQVWGDGARNLVLIPGIMSHLEFSLENANYVRWLEAMAEMGRVVVFDKRGNGMSDRIDGAPTLDERIRDVEAVMDAAGMARATLIGFSEGGSMAVTMAAMRPERVERVVICGGYPAGRRKRGEIGDAELEEIITELRANWGKPDGTHIFSTFGPDPSDTEAYDQFVRAQRMSCTPSVIAALFRMAADIDVRPLLGLVSVPALVVHREGEANNARVAKPLADGIPGAEYKVLPGTEHPPFEGDMDAYLAVVREFITGSAPAEVPGNRMLASVLFVDLVESTRRQAELGDEGWRRLMNRHDETCARQVARMEGRLVKYTGDGMLATFNAPTNAVACARAVADALSGLDLTCRCGIHTGEIEVRGDDVSGLGVVLAARIMEAADDGEILVSDLTRQLMLGARFSFDAAGEHALKGFDGNWSLYRVT